MNVLDIVLICFLILCALIGIFRGFFASLISFLGSVLSFTGAFFLAKPLATLLNNWFSLGTTLGKNISTQIAGFFDDFIMKMTGADILQNKCSATGFLKLAFQYLINPEEYYSKEEIIETIGSSAGNLILMAICLIVAYLIIKLVLFLLSKLFSKIKKSSRAINSVDKVLGFFMGAVKGLVIFAVICVIVNMLQSLPAVANALDVVFNKSVIARPIYNFVISISDKYIGTLSLPSLTT